MNCEDFNHILPDIAREQLLEARVRAAALEHTDSCDRCRARLEAERHLSRHLHALASAMSSLSVAPLQINPRVIASFRSQSRVVSLAMKTRRRKVWAAVVAAIMLLVIGLAVQRRNVLLTPSNSATEPPHQAEIQATRVESASTVPPNAPIKAPQDPNRRKSRALARHSLTNQARTEPTRANVNSEIATDFFSVGDTSPSSLADGGQLVRVELPRSALMTFGLPVNTDRANERVKADVLLGSDGIARAIRFVR